MPAASNKASATPLITYRNAFDLGSSAPPSSIPMNVSPSRILNLPLEKSDGQDDRHSRKSGQDKNIRLNARESRIFQEQRLQRVNGIGERIDAGNPSQPDRESLDRINGSRRNVQQCIQPADNGYRRSGHQSL